MPLSASDPDRRTSCGQSRGRRGARGAGHAARAQGQGRVEDQRRTSRHRHSVSRTTGKAAKALREMIRAQKDAEVASTRLREVGSAVAQLCRGFTSGTNRAAAEALHGWPPAGRRPARGRGRRRVARTGAIRSPPGLRARRLRPPLSSPSGRFIIRSQEAPAAPMPPLRSERPGGRRIRAPGAAVDRAAGTTDSAGRTARPGAAPAPAAARAKGPSTAQQAFQRGLTTLPPVGRRGPTGTPEGGGDLARQKRDQARHLVQQHQVQAGQAHRRTTRRSKTGIEQEYVVSGVPVSGPVRMVLHRTYERYSLRILGGAAV